MGQKPLPWQLKNLRHWRETNLRSHQLPPGPYPTWSNMYIWSYLIIFRKKKKCKKNVETIEMNEINPASRQSQILRGFWKDPTWCDTASSNSDFSKLDSEILNILKLHQGTISRPHACDACGTGADSTARISPDHQKPAKRQNGLWKSSKVTD